MTKNEFRNIGLRDAKFTSERGLGDFPRGVSSSYFRCLIITQSRVAVCLALLNGRSSLRMHIRHVVNLCAEEKVPRIATRWVITSMQDKKSGRDRAVDQFPHETMGRSQGAIDILLAISSGISTRSPKPTRVRTAGTVHLRPKAFDLFRGILGAHSTDLLLGRWGAVARSVRALPGFSLSELYPISSIERG